MNNITLGMEYVSTGNENIPLGMCMHHTSIDMDCFRVDNDDFPISTQDVSIQSNTM